MYKKILVPMALDHGLSPQTLKIAKTLCDAGGEIIALHVHEEPQGSVSAYLDQETVQAGFDRAERTLKAKLEAFDGVTPKIVKGHTARTIIDYAIQEDVDCIVIGSHKPGFGDFLIGSTTSRVARHATCAVHITPPESK